MAHVDKANKCAVVHAAEHGHLPVVNFLLNCEWSARESTQLTRKVVAQQALVAAAGAGHKDVSVALKGHASLTIFS